MNNSQVVSTCMWSEKHQRKTILALQRTFSALSLVGCIFIVVLIWLFKTYKYFVQRLILFLTISAAFQSFSFILGDLYENDTMCQFQAFIMQYFGWATLLWVLCITINIILVVRGVANTEKYEKWYHLICWLLSVFWSSLPFIGKKYGPACVWCWIKQDATALRFGTWYVPIFLVILFLVFAYVYIVLKVFVRNGRWSGTYNAEVEHDNAMLLKEVKPLASFPLIYLILTIPTLIYRIEDAVHPHQLPKYFLLILSVIFSPSVGALNAIAFAFYGEIQSLLTWNQIKSAFLSRFSSTAHITHNYDVGDDEESIFDPRV